MMAIFAHHSPVHWAESVFRAMTIIVMAMAGGAMARYYYFTRHEPARRMRVGREIALGCYLVAMGSAIFERLSDDSMFNWFQTPFIFIGSVALLIGMWPYLQFQHRRHPSKR